jgi:hypothetical protein
MVNDESLYMGSVARSNIPTDESVRILNYQVKLQFLKCAKRKCKIDQKVAVAVPLKTTTLLHFLDTLFPITETKFREQSKTSI